MTKALPGQGKECGGISKPLMLVTGDQTLGPSSCFFPRHISKELLEAEQPGLKLERIYMMLSLQVGISPTVPQGHP